MNGRDILGLPMEQQRKTRDVQRRRLLKGSVAAGAIRFVTPSIFPARGAEPVGVGTGGTGVGSEKSVSGGASQMIYRTLGRTGLKVSAVGLGGGGFSRLGLSNGKSEADTISLIHLAVDLGVNIIDTAAAYGTEPLIGRAIR